MIPYELGLAILIGVFALAGFLLYRKHRVRRAGEERLRVLGFEPCEDEAPRLLAVFRELAGGHGDGAEKLFQVARCFRKRAGTGFVYRFNAADVSTRTGDDDLPVPHVSEVYLLDLGARAKSLLRPCSLYLTSVGGGLLRSFLANLLDTHTLGKRLDIPPERDTSFLAAFGAGRGKLEDYMGPSLQELAASTAHQGFFAVHLGKGKAALLAPQGMRDVDAEWSTVSHWVSAA